MEDPYQEQGDDVRLDAPTPVVRVVLAEPDAPGPLQYLLEAEGFRVVGCASDEVELDRILQQDVDPDVVVLDTEISIASVAVARERAPAAHVIVVWPDAVLAPTGTERISPWLVYELLGPSIRARTRRPKPSLEASAAPEHPLAYAETLVETDAPRPTGRRVASRLTLTSVLLAALIVATMGAAFALDSLHISPALNLLRRGASSPPIAATHTSVPSPGVSHPAPDPHGSKMQACVGSRERGTPNAHASSRARDHQACPTHRHEPGHGPSAHPNRGHHGHGKPQGPVHGQPSHGNGGSNGNGGSSSGNGGSNGNGEGNGNGGSQGNGGSSEHPHGPPADPPGHQPSPPANGHGAHGHSDA